MSDQWSTEGRGRGTSEPYDPASASGMFSEETTTGAGSVGAGPGEAQGKLGGAAEQAKEAVGDVQQKAGELGDQASALADAGMQKAAGGLDSLASTIRERGESMGGGQAQSVASTAAEKLEAGAEMLRSTDTDQLVADLEALVRRRPVESLLVAAGVGYLMSRAL